MTLWHCLPGSGRKWKSPLLIFSTLTNGTTGSSSCCRNFPVFSTPGPRRKPGRVSRMFSTSVKSNPHPKIPRPERLDEIYMALKKGIQSVLSHWTQLLDVLSYCTCMCFLSPGITCRLINWIWTTAADRWKDPRGTPGWHVSVVLLS